MYKLCELVDNKQMCVKRLSDNVFIPFDEANTNYQEYLKWIEAGNTPLPAEEVGLQPTADEISE